MGDRSAPKSPMAWQGSLREMRAHGTRVAQTAACGCDGRWVDLDLDDLLAAHGPDWLLWDRTPPCVICGRPGHYMASPGPSTPYRPLLTGPAGELKHRQLLASFGFSRRDVVRIKAMAEAMTDTYTPRELNDLDVPFRIGVCHDGKEHLSTGQVLGSWVGRKLLYWPMNPAERGAWESRPKGPRRV